MAQDNDQEIFSDDPEEQLNIENEILKLKLQAELGGDYESDGILPPDIENAFLKNVIEFEHQFAKTTPSTLFDILGKPAFPKAASLTDEEIETALSTLENLMDEKGIMVDYGEEYPARIKYTFVTEELFLKESGFFHMPGMTMHYIYEEFHPNHRLDISNNTDKFFNSWLNQNFNEFSSELSYHPTTSDGKELTREELFKSFQNIFDSYTKFENASYTVDDIFFELIDEENGSGYAEGHVEYDAILENGEVKHFEGKYKLTMQYDGYWGIIYFEWPGFVW